ncbi:MAG: phosphomannomutase, partial [Synergistaceae bacterium]|nr:phosphomannomutase [Synergistaceae bacterium]
VDDDLGDVIFGDRLMALYWREILQNEKYKHAPVIIEPKCSMALAEEVEKLGGQVVYWKSGHSLIKAKMREINAPFAGEYSGHMFFADEYYGFDDSFYAAGRVLRIMDKANKSLSELVKSIPVYPATQEVRINCADNLKFAVVEEIKADALRFYQASVIDGIRILYPDGKGWGLIRASNTQPVIAVRCEGKSENALNEIMSDIKTRILAAGLDDFDWSF